MENKCSDSESFITQDDINNYESRCNEWISRMGRVALTVSTIDNVCSACRPYVYQKHSLPALYYNFELYNWILFK